MNDQFGKCEICNKKISIKKINHIPWRNIHLKTCARCKQYFVNKIPILNSKTNRFQKKLINEVKTDIRKKIMNEIKQRNLPFSE